MGLAYDYIRSTQHQMNITKEDSELTLYYKTISAKGKVVMAEKRARGERMHLAPLGYKNARDEHGRSILIPDPETYLLVREAKNLRADGMSIREICKVMERKGLRSRQGKTIGPSSMFKLFSSQVGVN